MMWNAKRVAVAALAALMIAGAVPALASEDASVNLPARQETAVQTHKRARKPARQSVASGDSSATSDGDTSARPARKPARQSVASGDSSATSDGGTSARPARKPARQSVASGDTTATSGGTAARPSRKPSRRPERNSVTDAVDTPAESGTI